MKINSTVGKVSYAVLFLGLLPLSLVEWARAADRFVALRSPLSLPGGVALASLGALLMLLGTIALRMHGQGLPMNAYPPPVLVERGVYRLFAHPIYVGFCLACFGAAIATGSRAGFWIVAPSVALGCAALVWGYEREDLRNRLGAPALERASGSEPPFPEERLAVYLRVLIPWLAIYETLAWFATSRQPVGVTLPFEARWPVVEWTELVYASVYPAVVLAPLTARTRGDLRRFARRGVLAMALLFPLYVLIPAVSPPRPFTPHGITGRLLAWERGLDTPAAAMPSFHVVWAMVAAALYARRWPRIRALAWAWAASVSASCVTTGMHAVLDVAAGLAASALIFFPGRLWKPLRDGAEQIANSWREWRIGRIRVINHGAWAGAGTFLGLVLLGTLLGPGHEAAILTASFAGLIGAALSAQLIEGSPQLLRPYGFHGGLAGVMLAALAAPLFGTPVWLLLGGYSLAAPLIQAFGRLRCLVQGCCHGRPAPPDVGIVYRHARSRVTRLASLAGVPLHPTPLYSILWNVVVEAAVVRLWIAAAPLHLIVGCYLILSGIGRFVEESFRGEPQTPVAGGLHIYHWIAAGTVLLGALLTAVGRSSAAPRPAFHWPAVVAAAVFGIVVTAALGVDAPESSRRFSRLA